MQDKHLNFLNNRLLDMYDAMLKVEEDWLKSINAPVERIPDEVAQAVSTRLLLSGLPLKYARWFIEYLEFKHTVSSVFGKKKRINYDVLLSKLQEDKSDSQIAKEIGDISHDTVRRHRLRFEKEGKLETKIKKGGDANDEES